jgi:hypothetical protein
MQFKQRLVIAFVRRTGGLQIHASDRTFPADHLFRPFRDGALNRRGQETRAERGRGRGRSRSKRIGRLVRCINSERVPTSFLGRANGNAVQTGAKRVRPGMRSKSSSWLARVTRARSCITARMRASPLKKPVALA